LIMKTLILVAAIAVSPLLSANLACAQAAISEPGLYSFYHPEGDLLGVGARQIRSGTPGGSTTGALAASTPRARRRTPRPAN
jgi:hypothetical protein